MQVALVACTKSTFAGSHDYAKAASIKLVTNNNGIAYDHHSSLLLNAIRTDKPRRACDFHWVQRCPEFNCDEECVKWMAYNEWPVRD